MELSSWVYPTVMVCFALVLFYMKKHEHQQSTRRQQWEACGTPFGLEYRETTPTADDDWRGYSDDGHTLHGSFEGMPVLFEIEHRDVGKFTHDLTTASLTVTPLLSSELLMTREGHFRKALKQMGSSEPQLGNEDVDARLYIERLPLADRRILSQRPIQDALTEAFEAYPHSKLQNGVLELGAEGFLTGQEFRALAEMTRQVAAKLRYAAAVAGHPSLAADSRSVSRARV